MMSSQEVPFWKRKQNPRTKMTSLRLLFFFGVGVLFFLLLMGHVEPKNYTHLQVGNKSTERILSPVTVLDQEATEQARKKAADGVKPEYRIDDSITQVQLQNLEKIFQMVKDINGKKELTQSGKIEELKKNIPYQLDDQSYRTLEGLPPETINTMQYISNYIVEEIMKGGVEEKNLQTARDQVNEQLVVAELTSSVRKVIQELARFSIIPNIKYDPVKTEEKREEARNGVEPIYIYEGDVLLNKGEVITPNHLRKLKLAGLMDEHIIKPYIGLALFILLILFSLWIYLNRSRSAVTQQLNQLFLYMTILLLNMGILWIFTLGQALQVAGLGYLVPAATGSILVSLLIDTPLAYFTAILFSFVSGILFNEKMGTFIDFVPFLIALVGGISGAYAVSGAQSRSKILRSGLYIGLANLFVAVMLLLLSNAALPWQTLLTIAAYSLANGILSGVFTLGLTPFLEAIFGILSPVKLIELSNPNQPLMRKLLIEAPGTYHHSVMVANLSEAAAEAIGANGLLARVGAYYHDVGKTKRPAFFIENQMGRENPHDQISPQLSKAIIIAHPYDGVKMLKESKFPKAIVDIAAQHHGTSLLKFFYHKALKENENAKEEDFRYPGPKPQFKESAVVSICDSVEAAVRALKHPTMEEIEELVDRLVKEKREDGQFDECDITLKEIDTIRNSILETLHGTFHSRIEYPQNEEVEGRQA
ncbi:conserved membrane hypothetical protein [[Clostridium] ultunense Esp]|nr:conserved membrane hypothetical protein [[Clostridium] ultunense Esp]